MGLRDKHEAGKSLNKEESTATTKTKDKPNEKTRAAAEKREQQVTNLHQHVTHPLSKTSVESEVKSEPAREKHKLKDVQPQWTICIIDFGPLSITVVGCKLLSKFERNGRRWSGRFGLK